MPTRRHTVVSFHGQRSERCFWVFVNCRYAFCFTDGVRVISALPLSMGNVDSLFDHSKQRGGLQGSGGARAMRRSFASNGCTESLVDPRQLADYEVCCVVVVARHFYLTTLRTFVPCGSRAVGIGSACSNCNVCAVDVLLVPKHQPAVTCRCAACLWWVCICNAVLLHPVAAKLLVCASQSTQQLCRLCSGCVVSATTSASSDLHW